MARKRKQEELPHTRRDDEPPASIPELDELTTELESLKGAMTHTGQKVVECKTKIGEMLLEKGIPFYEYFDARGVKKKVFAKRSIATCKVKVEKRTDEDSDDGDEE